MSENEINATDAAIELAGDLGINIAAVRGSGEDGRVLKSDVEALGVQPAPAPVESALAELAEEDDPGKRPPQEVVKRKAAPGAKNTQFRFRRHIDTFRPGDPVPDGVYSDDELRGMVAAGIID